MDVAEAPISGSIRVTWEVFAYSCGIHDAYIDPMRGFINPSALFIHPADCDQEPAEVFFDAPSWNVQCALPLKSNAWRAANLDQLLDSTYSLTPKKGDCAHVWTIDACGTPHQIVITGVRSLNRERICSDLQKIFEATIAFWDPDAKQAPFETYLLQMHLGPGLYGGLEHANGTMLLEDPKRLPAAGEAVPPQDYAEFLTLAAHEYFHAWLVKRLKPEGFLPYDLSTEAYSHDLWIFEGFTSLYESLIPYQAGLIDEKTYWKQFARRLNGALGREGFDRMTLADSSFNAWVKLYRQTEDSPYSQTSYYAKGALAAFLIDDALQVRSDGVWSLARLLQVWFATARQDIQAGRWTGLPDGGFAELALELTGISLQDVIDQWVRNPEFCRADWMQALNAALLRRNRRLVPDEEAGRAFALAGLKLRGRSLALDYVPSSSPAFAAGLFAGDEIAAVDGERASPDRFERMIEAARGRSVEVAFFRSDRLFTTLLDLSQPISEDFAALLPMRVDSAG